MPAQPLSVTTEASAVRVAVTAQTRRLLGRQSALATRPLLQLALADDLEPLRAALDAEVRAEQAKDRAYWEPLRREMEQFRREEREQGVC